jgi:D-beta-D-heptose 7-phosphate kinase/D-beta-D-heptose 1-phosphate adenosyltransferase
LGRVQRISRAVKIVVNGTFDVLHLGHLALLNYAKSLGDYLVVAIDSDSRVRSLKGPSRPVNNEVERKTLLENLRSVDEVKIFGTDAELVDIIKNCSIMVKGSDYRGKPIVGEEVCPQIVFFERIDEYSSTKKIQHIINRG